MKLYKEIVVAVVIAILLGLCLRFVFTGRTDKKTDLVRADYIEKCEEYLAKAEETEFVGYKQAYAQMAVAYCSRADLEQSL